MKTRFREPYFRIFKIFSKQQRPETRNQRPETRNQRPETRVSDQFKADYIFAEKIRKSLKEFHIFKRVFFGSGSVFWYHFQACPFRRAARTLNRARMFTTPSIVHVSNELRISVSYLLFAPKIRITKAVNFGSSAKSRPRCHRQRCHAGSSAGA